MSATYTYAREVADNSKQPSRDWDHNLQRRRILLDEMWKCIPLHPIRWSRLCSAACRLEEESARRFQ